MIQLSYRNGPEFTFNNKTELELQGRTRGRAAPHQGPISAGHVRHNIVLKLRLVYGAVYVQGRNQVAGNPCVFIGGGGGNQNSGKQFEQTVTGGNCAVKTNICDKDNVPVLT